MSDAPTRERRASSREGDRAPRPAANLPARMARWSARHWKTATFGWLAFVIVAFALGIASGTQNIDQETSGPGESGRADKVLDEQFTRPASELVLLQSATLTVADPAFRAAIDDAVRTLGANPGLQRVESPLQPGNDGQV
jgi:hypothetical protein